MPKRSRPAASGETEHWKEPILCEETRRKLEEFQKQGYIPPNHKKGTLRNIAKLERYWRRYCLHLQVDYKDHLTSEDPAVYMSFFDWMWELTTKSVEKSKRLQSYDGYWRALNQYFTLFVRRPMSNHVLEQVRRFLNHKFPAERGISRRAKEKLTLSVEEYGLFQKHWWKHSTCFISGNMIVQHSLSMLWCSITGTRPAVLFPEIETNAETDDVDGDDEEMVSSRRKKRRADQSFVSDVPQFVSGDDMPHTICYEDIDLFYLRNPEDSRDILCAVVNFRNFKGRPEGEDGTKFFMHCDYLLQYCPILHIVALAFRDKAFENDRLTPELIWRLKVPSRLPSLPLRWKKDKLKHPILRRMCQTANGLTVHQTQAMTYNHSRMALQDIGKGLGYQDDLTHYCFRRWAANAINKNYVQSERMRILGQSGNAVFEKHYQTSFITGLQEVVLARPSHAALCKEARKIRNRDPLAPKDLNDKQLAAIAKDTRLLDLGKERKRLRTEICMLAGTLKAAKVSHPELFLKHDEIRKQQLRMRKKLRMETRRSVRNEYFENMPVAEVDKQIDQLLDGSGTSIAESEEEQEDEENWEPPTPSYFFDERARIVEIFYGTDAETAETLDFQTALTRRTQVTKDLISLCGLSEPSRRGRRYNWDRKDIESDNDLTEIKVQAHCNSDHDTKCSTEICIVCERRVQRPDSLRRHLITQHLAYVKEGSSISCSRCSNNPAFEDVLLFLNHAAAVHDYDLKITLNHLHQYTSRGRSPRETQKPVIIRSLSIANEEEWRSETTTQVSSPQSSTHTDITASYPMQITSTQCIFCTWSTDEQGGFENGVMAEEHVRRQHLKVFEEDDLIPCPDPYCRSLGIVLFGHIALQTHVHKIHRENTVKV